MFDSLRVRLILLFAGLAIGPLIFVGVINGQRSFASLEQQSLASQQRTAMTAAREIRAFIDEHENELTLFDEVVGLSLRDLNSKKSLLNSLLLNQRVFQELRLFDPVGREQLRLSRTAVILDSDLRNRTKDEEFLVPATAGTTYFGPVRFDQDIQEPLMTISTPLFDRRSGQLAAVLAADLRFKPVWNLLAAIELPPGSDVYVVDRTGRVIAHRNPTVVLRGTVVDYPENNDQAEGLSGSEVIFGKAIVQRGDEQLVVVAEQTISEAFALISSTLRASLIISVIAFLVAVVLAILTVRLVVQPIEALALSAQAIAQGDFSQKVEVPTRGEIRDLGEAFNSMSDQLLQVLTGLRQEVAERTQAETALQKARDELEERVEDRTAKLTVANLKLSQEIAERMQVEIAREQLVDELEAKNAELERFTYTVSHDLKSPLVTIKGFLGLLDKDISKGDLERVQQDLSYIHGAAEKMQRLLNDLLELSRIGRVVNPPVQVSLGELAHEAVELTAGQIAEGKVQIDITPDLPVVWGDRPRLLEVMQNLIQNAVKFRGSQPEPRVEVGVLRQEEETLCYVRDNGIGIEPRYQARIFNLFDRLDPTVEGTGIGLALVQRIVEVHHGRVWVESEGKGQGSTFYFTIPRTDKSL